MRITITIIYKVTYKIRIELPGHRYLQKLTLIDICTNHKEVKIVTFLSSR